MQIQHDFSDSFGVMDLSEPEEEYEENTRLDKPIELGISLPCKVHNFSVIEMQNDFLSFDQSLGIHQKSRRI